MAKSKSKPATPAATLKIEIKNYRSCASNEGDAFSCTMYLNGKKAATVKYDGWGGSYDFDFSVAGKGHKAMSGPMHDLFAAHVKSLGKWKSEFDGAELDYNFDIVVEDVITRMLQEKEFRRWCKTKVVYSLKGDPKGSYNTIEHCKYEGNEAKIRAYLKKEFGDDLVEIINDRFAA